MAFGSCLGTVPLYENDFFRYYFDGQLHLQGMSPYSLSPSDYKGEELQWLKSQVPFAEYRTIYPPASQLLFTLYSFLSFGHLKIFNFLMAFFGYLGFIFSLRKFCKAYVPSLSIERFQIFLLNPLLLKEAVQSVHLDIYLVSSMLLSVVSSSFFKKGLWFGLAFGLKSSALVMGAFFLKLIQNREWRSLLNTFTGFALAVFLPSLFFWSSLPDFFHSFQSFGSTWEMNSGIYRWVRAALTTWGSENIILQAKSIVGLGFLSCFAYVVYCFSSPLKRVFWAFYLLLLFSPVSNPWYFLWVMPWALSLGEKAQLYVFLGLCFLPFSYAAYLPEGFPFHFLHFWNIEHIALILSGSLAFRSELLERK